MPRDVDPFDSNTCLTYYLARDSTSATVSTEPKHRHKNSSFDNTSNSSVVDFEEI